MIATYQLIFFIVLFILRFYTLIISKKNEQKLKAMGAVAYGTSNSTLLVIAHFGYCIACLVEGILNHKAFMADQTTSAGIILYFLSIVVLYYVIYSIRHVWTVKLIIAPKAYHTVNKNFLFKYIKHPNYFLNIIPELIGFAFMFHAYFTLIIGLPIYLIPLTIRIIQENRIIKDHFENY